MRYKPTIKLEEKDENICILVGVKDDYNAYYLPEITYEELIALRDAITNLCIIINVNKK